MNILYQSCELHAQSCPALVTWWTVAYQAPLPKGSSTQKYWCGLPCPSPGDLSNQGTKPTSLASPALAGGFFTTSATWDAPYQSLLYPTETETIPPNPNPPAHWNTLVESWGCHLFQEEADTLFTSQFHLLPLSSLVRKEKWQEGLLDCLLSRFCSISEDLNILRIFKIPVVFLRAEVGWGKELWGTLYSAPESPA